MKKDWNELEFTNISDFKRMAPSIIQLEISRISKILKSFETSEKVHNLPVKTRFELLTFKEALDNLGDKKISPDSLKGLFLALLYISNATAEHDEKVSSKINYIIDRLNDFINKCQLLY